MVKVRWTVDQAAQCTSVQNCTPWAARTFDDGNSFVCRLVGPVTESYFELRNQRFGMIACREGYFMTGLQKEKKIIRCSKAANPVSSGNVVRGVWLQPVAKTYGYDNYDVYLVAGGLSSTVIDVAVQYRGQGQFSK